MSSDPAFRCPVCRANQTLRDTCRRCKADLSLVARAYRRMEFLGRQRDQASTQGDQERAQKIAAELHWLVPHR